ncbi:MAG: CPBP family glutamic-type intramembrane protease [Thermoplasmata archaeon]|nr:CPBP family glutamic-type intramembrane protease [Thermoplasmata archaeon]
MTCDRCAECEEQGMKYCAYCGEELCEDCPECGDNRERGSSYCGGCGKRLGHAEPTPVPVEEENILGKIAELCIPVMLIVLLIEIAFMVAGTTSVIDYASGYSMRILMLLPHLVSVGSITGTALQIAWVLIELAVLASFVVLLWKTWKAMPRDRKPTVDEIVYSQAGRTGSVYAMAMAVSMAVSLIFMALGVDMGSASSNPTGNTPAALLAYADAGVWEEVISRFIPMGIPMAIAALAHGRKDAWRFLFGGFGLSRLSVALIFISALMFGFAHMSGWGLWKVLPSFLVGLLLGYLYARVGIHATILVHFALDYLAVISYTGSMALTGLSSILILVLVGLGFVALAMYAIKAWNRREELRSMPNWMPPDQEIIFSRREED